MISPDNNKISTVLNHELKNVLHYNFYACQYLRNNYAEACNFFVYWWLKLQVNCNFASLLNSQYQRVFSDEDTNCL